MKKHQLNPQKTILKAVNSLCDFIAPTYGPAGNKVIMSINGQMVAVDDGKTIAQAFELPNELENAVIEIVREVLRKTDERVGDGTTTSIILLRAFLREALKEQRFSVTELEKALKIAVEKIKSASKQIKTKNELRAVAFNSFNSDKVADIISEVLFEIGKDGIVTIEESGSTDITNEIVSGFRFDRGYISPYMVNQPEKSGAELEKSFVFVTDRKITNAKEIISILTPVVQQGGKQLLIVCDGIEGEALGTVIVNKIKGIIDAVCVLAPGFGTAKIENCQDISALTGAKFFSESSQRKFDTITLEDFGKTGRVIITQNDTTIVDGQGAKEDIQKRIDELTALLGNSQYKSTQDKIKAQIARLKGGVAVIRVGANTQGELKTLKYKVEDAVNATQIAFKSGTVPGAGLTLSKIKTPSSIFNRALKAPRKQLEINGKDLLDKNVVDPAGVLIAALESAISIVSLLLTTGGIQVEIIEKK